MIRDTILEKISGTIVGKDCRYEDIYLQIELEIDKISSVTQEISNFREIIDKCEYLLSNETKDFKLISWWFYANFKINNIEGIEYSIDCFTKFINKFYIDFYPKSNISKLNVIDWLEINLTKDFENNADLKNSIKNSNLNQKLINLSTALNQISKNNKEYFKEIIKLSKPSILEIAEILEEVEEKKEIIEQETKKDIVKTDIEPKIVEITTDFEANKVLRDFKKSASILAKYYRKSNFANSKSLLLTRFLFLLEFENLPISNGKKTSIYPPSINDMEQIENLFNQNNNSELLILSEEILEDCPFWLDGHFYTYRALKNTNSHKQANEVKSNFLQFLENNKQILNLNFIEDTPFASIKTKNWIEKELRDKDKIEIKKESIEIENDENFFEKIDNLISINNIKEAITIFEEKINLSKNIEEKFNWRLKFSKFAIDISKKDIAIIFLEELINEIEHFNLLVWNPKLASQVYILVLNNFSNLEYEQINIDSIYKKLCKIDINSALELNLNQRKI